MTIKQYAHRICTECGIKPQNVGYTYTVEAILMLYEDRSYSAYGITKRLYPSIAEKYGSTWCRVERAMRHAISTGKSKHTNSNFILSAVSFIDYCKEQEETEENYQQAKRAIFDSLMLG